MFKKALIANRGDDEDAVLLDRIDGFPLASERPKQADTFGGAVQC